MPWILPIAATVAWIALLGLFIYAFLTGAWSSGETR